MINFSLKNPSITTRVVIGKIIGFVIGIMAINSLGSWIADLSMMFRIGIVLCYITLGALISLFGVSTKNLDLNSSIPWWVRSFLIGAWVHFILTFFIYDQLLNFIITTFGENSFIKSPFWFGLQGGFIGIIMGKFAIVLEEGKLPKYWHNNSK